MKTIKLGLIAFLVLAVPIQNALPSTLGGSSEMDLPAAVIARESGRQLAESFSMDGVAGFVEGRAREAIKLAISQKGTEWLAEAFAKSVNAIRSGRADEIFRQDPELKAKVQAELKARIKDWLPGQMKELLVKDVLGGALGPEHMKEVEDIAGRLMKEIDMSLNERIDNVVGGMYDSTVAKLQDMMQTNPYIRWIDITDIKGTVKKAAQLSSMADVAAYGLSPVIGEGTVGAIRSRVTDALNGQLPPEAIAALKRGPEEFEKYVAKAQKYFPGNALRNLTNSVLNRPIIKLPSAAYAAILAATAAGHFAKAFKGVYVDAYELKRGVEVTRVMIWQLQNKQYIALTIMQIASLAKGLATSLGAGASFDSALSKITEPFKRIQKMADDIDKMLMKPINEVRGKLKEATDAIQKELVDLQETIVGPVRDTLDKAQQMHNEAAEKITGAIPDEFNGIPGSWEELKTRAGLEDGILGEMGNKSLSDMLNESETIKKFKRDLAKLNDDIADKLSNVAADALYGMGLIGPTAEILDVERTPARNESASNELDPVLLHNGEFVHKVTDVVIPGRGLDFRFTRTYRGRGDFLGELGWKWTHSYAERLLPWNNEASDGLTYIDDEGRKSFFREKDGGFVPPLGIYAALTRTETGFDLHSRDGLVTTFDLSGRLTEKRDRHGNSIKLFYNDTGLVSSIADSYGRKIEIARRKDGLISGIKDFAGRQFTYDYNDAKELIGVTTPATPDFPKGKTTAYRYAKEPPHAISMIMDPNGRVYLKNRYDNEGRVIAQSYGEGPWMTVVYEDTPAGAQERRGAGASVVSRAWVTDANGVLRLYEHDVEGHLLHLWRHDTRDYHLLASHSYNNEGDRISSCLPSGRCILFTYGEGEFRGDLLGVEEHPSQGKEKPRVTTIEREARYGFPISVTDPNGVEMQFQYSNTNLVEVKRGTGKDWLTLSRYSHNSCGQIVQEIDARGVVTHYEYFPSNDPDGDGVQIDGVNEEDFCGWLKGITIDADDSPQREASGPPLKRVTSFGYDPIGNIISTTGPDGGMARYNVNALNQIVREEAPGHAPRTYHFDANDNLARVEIDQGEKKIVHEFDYATLGRLVSSMMQISAGKFLETRYEYDPSGNLVRIVHPEGNIDDFEYNEEDDLHCIIHGTNSLERARECVERNDDGDVTAYVDAEGNRWAYLLNGFGEKIAEIDPLGNKTELDRDELGRVISIRNKNAEGRLLSQSRFEYDEDGRIIKRAQRLWRDDPKKTSWIEESFEYDANDNLVATCDPAGGCTKITRDGSGDETVITDPTGVHRMFTRDSMGRVIESYVASDKKLRLRQFKYDLAGRITEFNTGGDENWQYHYDGMGNLKGINDPFGVETVYELDDLGRPLAIIRDPKGLKATTRYEWNGNGRLASLADANGNTTRFAYDALNRLITEHYADGTKRLTTYDRRGIVTSSTDRNGSVLNIIYDANGQIVSRRAEARAGIIGTHEQHFGYDGIGRLISTTDFNDPDDTNDDIQSRFIYDSLSRPIAESQNDKWLRREFDEEGRVVTMTYPSGEKFFFSYDPSGRMDLIMRGSGKIASFEYGPTGDLIRQTLGKNMSLDIAQDEHGLPNERRYSKNSVVEMTSSKIRWDKGRVDTEGIVGGVERAYIRDPLSRLVEVKEGEFRRWRYNYDGVGNMTETQDEDGTSHMSFDSLNALKFISKSPLTLPSPLRGEGKTEFKYDANGNILSDGEREFRYDMLGRLTGVWRSGSPVARYSYDAFDRRVSKITGENSEENVWNGWQLVERTLGKNHFSYVYDQNSLTPVAEFSGAASRYFLSDRIGSVIAVSDEDGQISASCNYSPYGDPDCTGPSPTFGYAGAIYDSETDLLYMRHRYYDPKLGRFITPDPLSYKMDSEAPDRTLFIQSLSYHAAQGAASRATFPNRPLSTSANYGAYPFGRVFGYGSPYFDGGEPNLYLYAHGDPTMFIDPLGLASLIFDRTLNKLTLLSGSGVELVSFKASGKTASGYTKLADDKYNVGIPEFYSSAYRTSFYQRFNLGPIQKGESLVTGRALNPKYKAPKPGDPPSKEKEEKEYNYYWRLGDNADNIDDYVWKGAKVGYNESQGMLRLQIKGNYFIHGGRYNKYYKPTNGCIRVGDEEIEVLASKAIELSRQGDAIDSLEIREKPPPPPPPLPNLTLVI